jgi:tRNA A37 methylthiotransferase MiaB
MPFSVLTITKIFHNASKQLSPADLSKRIPPKIVALSFLLHRVIARLLSQHPITESSGPLGQGQRVMRKRLDKAPVAPLKIASGCDRRCSFCAIPSFRESFISRRPTEILDEAKWLVDQGVTELFLVSENTTSYGKDLGDLKIPGEDLAGDGCH